MLQVQHDFGEASQHDAAQLSTEPEDEDLALARVLQEQEQLFLRLRSSMQRRHSGAGAPPGSPMATSNSTTNAMPADSSLYARRDTAGSSTESASSSQGQSDDPADDDDMEFARQLQEEEDRAHYEHMLQMAGVGTHAQDEEQYLSDDSIDPDDMTYEQLQALGDTVGVVSRGASHNIMDSLQKCSYAQHRPEHAHEGCTEQCTVCCMEFEASDDVCVLECNHCYHTDCIAQWLKHSKKCPICHKEVAAAQDGSKAEGVKQSAPVLLSKKMTTNA